MWKGLFKDDLQRSFIIWETEEHNLHATVMGGSRLFVPEQRWRKSLNEPDVPYRVLATVPVCLLE